ncbi:unnamed protein product [Cyprideis torosa]|uniref:Uncharacterized protein n=1 Tax=Cyprideis torosa TaxID=163714 RepID=A0A7R8ZRS0_9CRUS|nr:unnamed protein product [Cyprideis torosa]CAG0894663.1 unnamed protein product [Cyprideis torosa]
MGRKRKIKRDIVSCEQKLGVAGLKIDDPGEGQPTQSTDDRLPRDGAVSVDSVPRPVPRPPRRDPASRQQNLSGDVQVASQQKLRDKLQEEVASSRSHPATSNGSKSRTPSGHSISLHGTIDHSKFVIDNEADSANKDLDTVDLSSSYLPPNAQSTPKSGGGPMLSPTSLPSAYGAFSRSSSISSLASDSLSFLGQLAFQHHLVEITAITGASKVDAKEEEHARKVFPCPLFRGEDEFG